MQDVAVPLILPFTAGMLAFINPCGIALLPAYVSYYLGLSMGGPGAGAGTVIKLSLKGLLLGLLATMGFMLVFGGSGLVFSLVGAWLIRYVPWLATIIGAGIAVIGSLVLLGRTPSIQLPSIDSSALLGGTGVPLFVLFGVAYAIASLSCTIPVFLYITLLAVSAGGFIGAMAVFLAYSLGMGASMTVFSTLMVTASSTLNRLLEPMARYSLRVAGLIMIASGAYIVYFQVFVGGLVG